MKKYFDCLILLITLWRLVPKPVFRDEGNVTTARLLRSPTYSRDPEVGVYRIFKKTNCYWIKTKRKCIWLQIYIYINIYITTLSVLFKFRGMPSGYIARERRGMSRDIVKDSHRMCVAELSELHNYNHICMGTHAGMGISRNLTIPYG